MGRPLSKHNFGDTSDPGSQIRITADVGSGIGVGFIIAQKSLTEFDVNIGGNTGRIRLVNSTSPGVGEGYVLIFPVGSDSDGSGGIGTATLGANNASIVVPGSGYLIADTITVSGGTRSEAAIFNITTLQIITATVNANGTIYALNEVITNNTGTGTQATFLVSELSTIASQDQSDFDGAGSNGTFVGGGVGAYVAADTITLSDGTIITVGSVDGSDDVLTFIVTTNSTSGIVENNIELTQTSTDGNGTDFTLTLGDANQEARTVSITTPGSYTTNPTASGSVTTSGGAGTGLTLNLLTGLLTLTISATDGAYSIIPAGTLPTSTGGAGTNGTITVIWDVSTIAITAGGSLYDTAPTVVITGGGGENAAATTTVDSGAINGFTVTTPGIGYTTPPTIGVVNDGALLIKKITQNHVLSYTNVKSAWTYDSTPFGTQVSLDED